MALLFVAQKFLENHSSAPRDRKMNIHVDSRASQVKNRLFQAIFSTNTPSRFIIRETFRGNLATPVGGPTAGLF